MSSSSSDKELEEQLAEAGKKLLEPPSAVDELLPLLDRVETCLSRVEQSPSKSMQKALSPSQKALVANRLFRHSEVDVKVAVASCISEITRISAPEAPYDDDQMKEVFQLIVSSFQNLSDKSSRSYAKRASILETVAKVRSCVVMLDLECDTLILEMFEHFLKEIREYHPENVFTSMETIMTLVIEESEDISPELLSPVLACVKKDNEDVLPIAKKLGEKVLEKCAVKLRPYLSQALKSSGVVLDDYSKVIASICQDKNGAVEQTELMEKERSAEEPSTQDVPAPGESPKAVVNNGSTQLDKDDCLEDPVSVKKEEDSKESASKMTDGSSNGDLEKLDTEKARKEESKAEQAPKRRGRRSNMSSKSVKPSSISRVDGKDAENVKDTEKEPDNDASSLPHEDLKCEAKIPSESEKEDASKPSTDKAVDDISKDDEAKADESNVSALPTLNEEIPDESQAQEAGSQKDKEDSAEDVKPSAVDISKKESAETASLQVETDTKRMDDSADDMSSKERTITVEETSKEDDATSGSDVKILKASEKKLNASSSSGEGTARKKPEDRRKQVKSRLDSEKNVKKSAGKYDNKGTPSPKVVKKPVKDEKYLGETSKDNLKRKRSLGKEEDSDMKSYWEDLVGSKIKVWWPLDKKYYEGVVDAFDSVQKKHKVVYEDGDVEILNLKAETWKLVERGPRDKGQPADRDSSDALPEIPLKKRAKASPGLASVKKVKVDMSSKKSGGTSSGKSKASVATTSGHKSRDGRKTDGNFEKDQTPKSTGKATLKMSGKSKDTELITLKTGKSKVNDSSGRSVSTKSDREIQKSDKSMRDDKSTSKGKGPRSLGKASASSSGKLKLGSPKPKENEIEDEDSEETPEVPLSKKARLLESSKAQAGKSSTGKKRRKVA